MAVQEKAGATGRQEDLRRVARKRENGSRWGAIARYLAVAFIVFISLAPLYWTFTTSIKNGVEVTASPPTLFPQSFVLDNYIKVVTSSFFLADLRNSAVIASVTTLLALIIGVLCAYA